MTSDKIIEVRGLYVSFHTEQGTVKALDGIDLHICRGETMGLVGESGCGKSLTANAILRLIPQPPGRYDAGQILFAMPMEVQEKMAALEEELRTLRPADESRRRQLEKALLDTTSEYDLLQRSPGYMRRIRGNYISMIFQEPMSALNPVLTAGDQIAEIVILHRRASVAGTLLERTKEEVKEIGAYRKGSLIAAERGGWQCARCGAVSAQRPGRCESCGDCFHPRRFRRLGMIKRSWYISNYRRMIERPDSWATRAYAKIPLVRGFEKQVENEGLLVAESMLRLVRIPDPHALVKSYPHELSGGMQQRVMIAIALACKPAVLIADEPTTALDVTIQAQILKLMKELQEETGTSILLITHNLGVVAEICDRIGVMYAGTIAELGGKMEVFKEPLHPYTQGLLNSIPRMSAETTRLETIEGSVPDLADPPGGCRFHPRCPFAMGICSESKPVLTEIRPQHFVACHLYAEVMPRGT